MVIASRPACGCFRTCTSAEYRAPSYPPKASNAAPPPTATTPAPSAASDDPASTSAALVHSTSPSTADTLSATVSLRPPSAPPPPVMYQASPTTAPAAYARGTGAAPAGCTARHVIAIVSRTKSSPDTSPAKPRATPPNTNTLVTAPAPAPKLAATCPARGVGAAPGRGESGVDHRIVCKSTTWTSSRSLPRRSSPPNTMILAPYAPRTSVALWPPLARGAAFAGLSRGRRDHSIVFVSSTHASVRASSLASRTCPPTTTIFVPHTTAACPARAVNSSSPSFDLVSARRHVIVGRLSTCASANRRPDELPPTTKTSSPTVAMACAYRPRGNLPEIWEETSAQTPSSATMRSTEGSARGVRGAAAAAAASALARRSASAPARVPAAATASAAISRTSATRSGSPPSVTRSYQSGFSSSMVDTYIFMASIAGVSPSWVHELHLALSMAFHPQGLAARHGPAVTWREERSEAGQDSVARRVGRRRETPI